MKLRNYQTDAVQAAVTHFKQASTSAVIVLPTGAGKSIVIAELARIAKGRVLILTHVKELVAQNAEKIGVLTAEPSIYSAGLNQKSTQGKVVVASIQSAARADKAFEQPYSLVIVDECHRISGDKDSQYQQLFQHLRHKNPNLRLLGLTATPYRLGLGWIYKFHYHGKIGNPEQAIFEHCIFELPLRPLIKQGYLTPPKILDGLSAQYDFKLLNPNQAGEYSERAMNDLLHHSGRATTAIVRQIQDIARSRQGVIIFAATVRHAQEIIENLEQDSAALITATTSHQERDSIIHSFKSKQIKFIVNVAVLTTGFDAPHVDFIAILRPTASVSLFQQMVGRGLRLADNKEECLIIDYAANGYDLYFPEVGFPKPTSKAVPVQILCPECNFANIFWGLTDNDGDIIEHFGRRCQALTQSSPSRQQCDYRFRSKSCPNCHTDNDIAARICHQCDSVLIDPDKRLQQVLQQKHHHLFKCHEMLLEIEDEALKVIYFDIDGNEFVRYFKMKTTAQIKACFALFIHPHTRTPGLIKKRYNKPQDIVEHPSHFRSPQLLLLKKHTKSWQLVECIFDYQGRYHTHESPPP